ncbi:MAG: hypothetical protein ACHQ50_03475 [Fimbriimonadales bacterium]
MQHREAKWKLALELIGLAVMSWIFCLRDGADRIMPALFTIGLAAAAVIHARAVNRLARLQVPPPPKQHMTLTEACEVLDRATEDARWRASAFQPRSGLADPASRDYPAWHRASRVTTLLLLMAATVLLAALPLSPMWKSHGVTLEAWIVPAVLLGSAFLNAAFNLGWRIRERRRRRR